MANKITVVLEAVTDKATRGFTSFKQSVSDADGAVGKMKAGAKSLGDMLRANAAPAAAVAGAAAIKFGKDAVEAASSLEESMNAVNVTFGPAADGIHALGETSVESFGISQRAFNEAAVSMSSFAETVAGEGGNVAGTMDDLIGRATDFASVYNLDISEALQVFQSTLAGQTEPIRRYGKDVSAAAVEQYAFANGLAESKSEMTEAIKVQARYGLLMEQTSDTAGDFANTQDSLANQTRTLKANYEDLSATLGQELIPVVTELVSQLNEAAESAGPAFTAFQTLTAEADESSSSLERMAKQAGDWGQSMAMMFVNPLESYDKFESALMATSIQLEEVAKFEGVLSLATELTTKRTEERAYWAGKATRATEEQADAERDLAVDVKGATRAIDDQLDAVRDLISQRRRASDATWDARDAEDAFHDAVAEATAALEDSEASQRDQAAAVRDATRATDEMISKQLEEQGVLLDTEAGNRQWTESMRDAALFMGGPLGAEILAHIGRVNSIPEEKITEAQAALDEGSVERAKSIIDSELDKAEANVGVQVDDPRLQSARRRIESILGRTVTIPVNTYTPNRPGSGRLPYGAEGGIVNRPTVALIGEAGPEAVVPLDKTPGNGPLPSNLGGGSTFQITVNAGIGANGADVGRQVVDAIKKFEKSNGAGWRGVR